MLDEQIENLQMKPLPKKHEPNIFFIEKKRDADLPTIIDKTGEKKVNPDDFINKIYKEIGIFNEDRIITKRQIEEPDTLFEDIKETTPIKEQEQFIGDKLRNVMKTSEKIIIRQYQEENKRSIKLPQDTDIIDMEISKKSKYEKKYKTISDDSEYNSDLQLKDTKYRDRLPKQQSNILIKAADYYLYNRENFINFINNLFLPYKDELLQEEKDIADGKITVSCDESLKKDFSLLTHQQIVRDYINVFSPYRGLLLYHGLGSGKTCSSIAIAEGIKNDKKVLVMTPASLKANYIEELKKCGDFLYKKNQFWEFIDTNDNPEQLKNLSSLLKLPQEYIKKNNGAWFVNVQKKPNYEDLTFEKQQQINNQINLMIDYKYEFISYNGLRKNHLTSMTKNGTINPFNNKVIIIDEAHNFISRIVNKITKKEKTSLSMQLYDYLMEAENCKIILLSGTPIINYPNEIGILFNILRGSIKTYGCKLNQNRGKHINKETLEKLLTEQNIYQHVDNIDYNSQTNELSITKNPFGFVKSTKQNKIAFSSETLSSEEFKQSIFSALKQKDISIIGNDITVTSYKALPDTFDEFKYYFIDDKNKIKNTDMFKMRILGLTSYFRSAQEQLMPAYQDEQIQIVQIPMSDVQLGTYQEARIQERKLEKKNKPKKPKNKLESNDIYSDSVSTYRIFSRAFCNFVFPQPDIKRPIPNKTNNIKELDTIANNENISENILDVVSAKETLDTMDNIYEADDIDAIRKEQAEVKSETYQTRILTALKELEKNSDKYLTPEALLTYSPKFLAILKNMINQDYKGIHLLYSQFKTLEGIGIFKLVLKQNNFAEFKLKKGPNGYKLDIKPDDIGKSMFASYSGDETPEEREIIKNVLNSNWNLVSSNIVNQLKTIATNNHFGEIIKVLMITSSGAEGISLKNVRYVHIMEPYWHPVRIHQVIGRARRICSHSDLPKELQTVDVFIYLMTFTEEQRDKLSIDLRKNDLSKKNKSKVITSDEFLYEISMIKEELNKELLTNVKQSAIDCSIHSRSTSKEKLQCFSIGNPNEKNFAYVPDIKKQDNDKLMQLNKKTVGIKLQKIRGKNHGFDKNTNLVYDWDASRKGNLILIGKYRIENDKYIFENL